MEHTGSGKKLLTTEKSYRLILTPFQHSLLAILGLGFGLKMMFSSISSFQDLANTMSYFFILSGIFLSISIYFTKSHLKDLIDQIKKTKDVKKSKSIEILKKSNTIAHKCIVAVCSVALFALLSYSELAFEFPSRNASFIIGFSLLAILFLSIGYKYYINPKKFLEKIDGV